jgi:Pentapeptide repeats (8 copies)
MVKRRLVRVREKLTRLMRGALIGALVLPTVMGLLYLTKPLLWSGGLGIGKDETVTKEIVEKDDKGNLVKKTTKYDDGKTLWDWLSLLGVPLYLALLGLWFQWIQQKRSVELAHEQRARDEKIAHELRERDEKVAKEQRELAAEETKEEVLQVYFDRLSVLLVDKNLLAIAAKIYASETQENEGQQKIGATLEERELLDSAVHVIRARTLSILRRFENDRERKTSVIQFLIEADIVSKLKLNLRGANLSGVNLSGAFLVEVDLSGVNLSGANLHKAYLTGADLSDTDLTRADLSRAKMKGASLYRANFDGADLSRAYLFGANLSFAHITGADLFAADLKEADLTLCLIEANLSRSIFANNRGLSDVAKADIAVIELV